MASPGARGHETSGLMGTRSSGGLSRAQLFLFLQVPPLTHGSDNLWPTALTLASHRDTLWLLVFGIPNSSVFGGMVSVDSSQPRQNLDRVPLRDQAYGVLRSWIIRGTLAPGSRLLERDLADRLGVSRAPVKAALLRLEREGFVTSNGAARHVVSFEPADLAQVYSVRCVLERMAAECAASRVGVDHSVLLQCLDEFADAVRSRDVERFAQADFDLHRAVWTQAGNPHLKSALDCIAGSTFILIIEYTRHEEADWEDILHQHEELVQNIINGDRHAAGRAMEAHIQFSETVCTKLLLMAEQPRDET